MNQNGSNDDNVVNLAEKRRKQRTLKRQGAAGLNGAKGANRLAGGSATKLGVWAYVQFFLFLGLTAYLMRLCSG